MSNPRKPTQDERQTRKKTILDEVGQAQRGSGKIQLRDKEEVEKESLKNEIREALEKESLKREILDELNKPKNKLAEFFKHPAVIVVITFILTGLLGAWLTAAWQSREWDRQQALQSREWNRQQIRLVQIREIEQRYKIVEDVSAAVTGHDAAARDALITFTWPINRLRAEEAPERMKHWRQVNKEWRANSQKLLQTLIVHFKDPRVQLTFEEMLEERRDINDKIEMLQAEVIENSEISEDEKFKKKVYDASDSINRTTGNLRHLVEVMVAEIRTDVELHEK
jgi:hypothetical protein